jgi:hypothetical protein
VSEAAKLIHYLLLVAGIVVVVSLHVPFFWTLLAAAVVGLLLNAFDRLAARREWFADD